MVINSGWVFLLFFGFFNTCKLAWYLWCWRAVCFHSLLSKIPGCEHWFEHAKTLLLYVFIISTATQCIQNPVCAWYHPHFWPTRALQKLWEHEEHGNPFMLPPIQEVHFKEIVFERCEPQHWAPVKFPSPLETVQEPEKVNKSRMEEPSHIILLRSVV